MFEQMNSVYDPVAAAEAMLPALEVGMLDQVFITAGKYFGQTLSEEERNQITFAPGRKNRLQAIGEGVWPILSKEQRAQVLLKENQANARIQRYFNYFVTQTNGNAELALRALQIFSTLISNIAMENWRWNEANNLLLAGIALNAAETGVIGFWRFVCMPKIDAVIEDSQFTGWQIKYDDYRYDTLSPALPYDKKLLTQMQSLGLKANLTLVLDDWEVLFYRTRARLAALGKVEAEKAKMALKPLLNAIRLWILNTVPEMAVRVKFFSDPDMSPSLEIIEELISTSFLEGTAEYSSIFAGEKAFVQSADQSISGYAATQKAALRISQYAVEGAIIQASELGNSIYLNAEYPVDLVWKKLTLMAQIPTLFYVTDKQVKNI